MYKIVGFREIGKTMLPSDPVRTLYFRPHSHQGFIGIIDTNEIAVYPEADTACWRIILTHGLCHTYKVVAKFFGSGLAGQGGYDKDQVDIRAILPDSGIQNFGIFLDGSKDKGLGIRRIVCEDVTGAGLLGLALCGESLSPGTDTAITMIRSSNKDEEQRGYSQPSEVSASAGDELSNEHRKEGEDSDTAQDPSPDRISGWSSTAIIVLHNEAPSADRVGHSPQATYLLSLKGGMRPTSSGKAQALAVGW